MKKILIIGSAVAGLATAGLVLVPGFASAQSATNTGNGYGYQRAMTSKADALGMTEAELRTQLETKTMLQVAQDKGLTKDQWQDIAKQSATQRWQDRGLTQAEIDTRLQDMSERQADCDGDGSGGGGMHRGRNNS